MGLLRNWIDRQNRQAVRFGEMVERSHVDLAYLGQADHGNALRGAIERCGACRATAACEAWLADGAATEPTFCPNHALFARHVAPES